MWQFLAIEIEKRIKSTTIAKQQKSPGIEVPDSTSWWDPVYLGRTANTAVQLRSRCRVQDGCRVRKYRERRLRWRRKIDVIGFSEGKSWKP